MQAHAQMEDLCGLICQLALPRLVLGLHQAQLLPGGVEQGRCAACAHLSHLHFYRAVTFWSLRLSQSTSSL